MAESCEGVSAEYDTVPQIILNGRDRRQGMTITYKRKAK